MAVMMAGLNLVLLGHIGAGKSASGNTILGRQAFESKESFNSVTLDLAVESGTVYGRRVTVYDTPGLFNTKLSEEEIQQIYEEVLQRCESGQCAFLLVIRADRFTEEERKTVEKIEELLGETRLKKTWILFTGRDELEEENMTIKEFIDDTEALKRLVQKYEQRYHVFNNKKKEPNGQVQELLTKIYATHPDTIEKGAKPKQTVVKISRGRISVTSGPSASAEDWSPGKTGVGKSASGNTMEEERRKREEKQRQEEIERVRKETEERIREEFDGPPRFLQERLKEMRLGEEERRRQEEERLEELERDFHCLMSRCRKMEMERKEEEEQRLEEIERVIKETEERVKAVCEGPPRFLQERLESMRLREEEGRRRVEEIERDFFWPISRLRHMALQREEEEQRLVEIEKGKKETEERVRAVCEGPLRFLQERLESMKLREEERWRRVEEQLEELERDFHHLMSEFKKNVMSMEIFSMSMNMVIVMKINMGTVMEMQRKEKRREIERVINESEERVKAEFEGPLRFLQERRESMRQREEERRRVERMFPIVLTLRLMGLQRKEEKEQTLEIERVIKETEERVRAVCEGPLRFLQERLESMRQREEERRRRVEEQLEWFESFFHYWMSRCRRIAKHNEMQRRQEEIERLIKETEERIRAEFEDPPR